MMRKPTEVAIQQVMQETGMEYLQAYRHLQQRYQLQDQCERETRRQCAALFAKPLVKETV